MASVGDTVNYLPHEVHALERGPVGDLPWLIGRIINPPGAEHQLSADLRANVIDYLAPGAATPVRVEVLRGHRIDQYLSYLGRLPAEHPDKRTLVPLVPLRPWPAKVKAVHDDGALDLKVITPRGVELHIDSVPGDDKHAKPHSWHHPSGQSYPTDQGADDQPPAPATDRTETNP